jgi:hypothetical protein
VTGSARLPVLRSVALECRARRAGAALALPTLRALGSRCRITRASPSTYASAQHLVPVVVVGSTALGSRVRFNSATRRHARAAYSSTQVGCASLRLGGDAATAVRTAGYPAAHRRNLQSIACRKRQASRTDRGRRRPRQRAFLCLYTYMQSQSEERRGAGSLADRAGPLNASRARELLPATTRGRRCARRRSCRRSSAHRRFPARCGPACRGRRWPTAPPRASAPRRPPAPR